MCRAKRGALSHDRRGDDDRTLEDFYADAARPDPGRRGEGT